LQLLQGNNQQLIKTKPPFHQRKILINQTHPATAATIHHSLKPWTAVKLNLEVRIISFPLNSKSLLKYVIYAKFIANYMNFGNSSCSHLSLLLIYLFIFISAQQNKTAQDNRANQQNPNHQATGPGRDAGYGGQGTKPDLSNHANQMNPNNPRYTAGKK
jgi:hypothetical protein